MKDLHLKGRLHQGLHIHLFYFAMLTIIYVVSKYLLIGNTAGTALVFTAILNMDGKAGSLSDNLFYALCIFSFGSICAIIAIGWLFIHYYSTVKFSQRLHDGIVYHKYLKVWQEANRLLNDPLAETVGQVARYKSLINSNQKEIERQKNLMTSKFGLFITLIFISSSCFSTVLFVTFITGVLNLAS